MAILQMNFRSDALARSVYPVAFLPDLNGWMDQEPPYKTLYFLHGYSGGALETAQFTNFALFSMMHGIAIVMIDGENSFYTDDEQRGAMFSRYAGQEIVEATRAVLPLSHRREDTFIGGISMGGYGALINGLRYKETFSRIAMLSPALGFKRPDNTLLPGTPCPPGELNAIFGTWDEYQGSYKDYLAASKKAAEDPATMPEIFLGIGRQDPLVYEPSREYAEEMKKLGIPITWWEADGGHDHTLWKKAMTPACNFLTGKKAE